MDSPATATAIAAILGGGVIGSIVTTATTFLLNRNKMQQDHEVLMNGRYGERIRELEKEVKECLEDRQVLAEKAARLEERVNLLEELVDRHEARVVVALVEADDHGTITAWNHAAQVMFGYRESEVVGKRVDMLIPYHLRGQHEQAFHEHKKVMPGSPVRTLNTYALNKRGDEFPITIDLSSHIKIDKLFFVARIKYRSETITNQSQSR